MPMDRALDRRFPQWIATLVVVFVVLPAFAGPPEHVFDRRNSRADQFLVETTDIDRAVAEHGLEVLARRGGPRSDLWLVRAPEGVDLTIAEEPYIGHVEPAILASLPALELSAVDATAEASEDLSRVGTYSSPCVDAHLGEAWSGFADQRATHLIQLRQAQDLDASRCGAGVTVAILDTEIDATHPLLADALVAGHDFLVTSTETQTTDLDTRIRTIVESSETAVLSGAATLAVLDTSALLLGEVDEEILTDLGELPEFYGHGTMVAGLVRLVAPGASIMPLRVFDDEGYGHVFDIVDAIYYAVDNGADVINMSFSMRDASAEVQAAVDYARQNGVSTIGAAGNQGEQAVIYPAAFESTIGVASTDFADQLSEFTNYGLITADLSAPGNALVTLFPGGAYAAGWGTSFSAPLASGVVALIRPYHAGANRGAHKQLRYDLLLGTTFYDHLWDYILASGRLDGYGAMVEAKY